MGLIIFQGLGNKTYLCLFFNLSSRSEWMLHIGPLIPSKVLLELWRNVTLALTVMMVKKLAQFQAHQTKLKALWVSSLIQRCQDAPCPHETTANMSVAGWRDRLEGFCKSCVHLGKTSPGVSIPAISQPQFAESLVKVSQRLRYFARVTPKVRDLFCPSYLTWAKSD